MACEQKEMTRKGVHASRLQGLRASNTVSAKLNSICCS